ncbi:hypothetical protein ACWGDE_06440 [Streptomyces sp. NPDC054956]
MRVDDVLSQLTPEHFSSGRIPSRTTVAERLAGVGLDSDFVEAIADVCSSSETARLHRMGQVGSLREYGATAEREQRKQEPPGGRTDDGGSELAAELVVVQKRSIEVSDKLMRAMERATELERERNSANHMVLLLLTMVEKLQRDITTLARERDRLRTTAADASLRQVRARLVRSEEQRTTAESELERARAERHKADLLAEEAADQVRILTEELERHRGRFPAHETETRGAMTAPPALREALDTDPDDIDDALAKAARHLDDRAHRLDRLADELHQDSSPDGEADIEADNEADNPPTSGIVPDYWVGDDRPGQPAGPPAAHIPGLVSGLRGRGRHGDAVQLLNAVGQLKDSTGLRQVLTVLREAGQEYDADLVLAAVGRLRLSADVPDVLAHLTEPDRMRILDAAHRERPLPQVPSLIEALSGANLHEEASYLSTALGAGQEGSDQHRFHDAPPGGYDDSELMLVLEERGGVSLELTRRSTYGLGLTTVVRTVGGARKESGLPLFPLRVLNYCLSPSSVGQIAQGLGLPFGFTQSVVEELVAAGQLVIVSGAE